MHIQASSSSRAGFEYKGHLSRYMDSFNSCELCLKWLNTIFGFHRSPMLNPHLLTYMCTSHSWSLVSKNTTFFVKSQTFSFFHWWGCAHTLVWWGPRLVAILLESHYCVWINTPITKPHFTFSSDVILRWVWIHVMMVLHVNSLAENTNVSISNNNYVIWLLHISQKPYGLWTSSKNQINHIRHVILVANLVAHLWHKLFEIISLIPISTSQLSLLQYCLLLEIRMWDNQYPNLSVLHGCDPRQQAFLEVQMKEGQIGFPTYFWNRT